MEQNAESQKDLNKKKEGRTQLLLAVISYFPFFCAPAIDDILETLFLPQNKLAYDMLVGVILITLLLLPVIFTIKLGQKKGKWTAVILILVMYMVWKYPIGYYQKVRSLRDSLPLYNEAVECVLEKVKYRHWRQIMLPPEYEETTYYRDPPFAYYMRDDNTIKIFFCTEGLLRDKGYLYVINQPDATEPYKKPWNVLYDTLESDNGGVWEWAVYDWEELPDYSDRNWR